MAKPNETVIGFKNVDFSYDIRKPILDEVNIDKQIADILNVINLKVKDYNKKISSFLSLINPDVKIGYCRQDFFKFRF